MELPALRAPALRDLEAALPAIKDILPSGVLPVGGLRADALTPDVLTGDVDWRAALRLPAFELRHVHVVGLRRLGAEDVTRELGLSEPVSLLDVRPPEVCAQLRRHGRIAACSAVRIPPGVLAIAVRERVPVAVVASTGQGLDADGVPFDLLPGEGSDLPRIRGEVARALDYVLAARSSDVELREVEVRPAGTTRTEVALWPRGRELRILPDPHPAASLERYRTLLAAGVIDREGLELDLRFRGRVFLREMAPAVGGGEGDEA